MSALLSRLRRLWAEVPVAVSILLIYLAARLMTTIFLLLAAAASTSQGRFGAHATLSSLTVGWDATWYWYLAENGYPSVLPHTMSGLVSENQWAFMPLFPYLAQGLRLLTGSWGSAAVIISLVAGYLSCLVLHRLLRRHLDGTATLWAVTFFAAGPLAALFQVGYAESLFLLWLFLGLLVVEERRYAWLFLLVPLMAATRPSVPAFALFLALHGIVRFLRRRRDPLPVRHVVQIIAAGLWAVVCGFAWQFVAAWVTGNPNAYLLTELSWRRNWIPDAQPHFAPFDGFIEATGFWSGIWQIPLWLGFTYLALAVVIIAALLLFEPHVRRLGSDLRLWSASYLLYLLAVFFPQSSIFRLLVPVAPLAAGALAAPRSTPWRVSMLLLCLVAQWFWIYNVYGLANNFWRIP